MFHLKTAGRVGEMLIFVSAPEKTRKPERRPWRNLLAVFVLAAVASAAPAFGAVSELTPDERGAMHSGGVIAPGAPLPLERLRKVNFSYLDFNGVVHADGSVVVLDAVAPQVQQIFDALLARRIPLQQARPMQQYRGDDEASMRANNSSAFNGRAMTGGSAWSKHAWGVAIDVNPLQNPYLSNANGQRILLPPDAAGYLDRRTIRPGMAETMVDIFAEHGFLIWGGRWHEPIDYQHFEIGSRAFIAALVALDTASAQRAFAAYALAYRQCLGDGGAPASGMIKAACIAKVKR